MIKKGLFFGIIVFLAVGILASYASFKQQAELKQAKEKEEAKAEEISITLIEGWNNKEIGQYLEKKNIVPASDFLTSLKDFDVAEYGSFLPKEAKANLQGFLYPDTYRLFASLADRNKTTSAEASREIIAKLLNNFEKKLPAAAGDLAGKHKLNLYEAVILASIIEKETGRNAVTDEQRQALDIERKIIAGIFYNRLKIGMALESDATVNYLTGKNLPAVDRVDTEIDSPYNTYKYRGLPPTPICNPSLSSILAALNPEATSYFYFLHEQSKGKAIYAKTYEDHLANKQKYLK